MNVKCYSCSKQLSDDEYAHGVKEFPDGVKGVEQCYCTKCGIEFLKELFAHKDS